MPIILRPFAITDVAALAAIANNKHVSDNLRNSFPHPYTISDAKQWIQLQSKIKPAQNFAITYNGLLAGTIGCTLKEDIHKKNIELGYFVGEIFWNKGIASKAVSLMVAYIEQNFQANRIYAEVFENNIASMKVLQKNNFFLEAIHHNSLFKHNQYFDAYIWVKPLS